MFQHLRFSFWLKRAFLIPAALLFFQLQSFQEKYDTSHGTGSGVKDEDFRDQCSILVGCRLDQLLIQVNKKN